MLNKSYSYLIPLVNEYCKIDSDFMLLLDNVYTKHLDYPDENMIIISYEFIDNDLFLTYIETFRSNELFKEMYIDEENISIILYFPLAFIPEYFLYMEGKFSQFSERAKTIILSYILDVHKLQDADRVRRVLYRDEELRRELEYKLDMKIDPHLELSSLPDMDNETFVIVRNEYN